MKFLLLVMVTSMSFGALANMHKGHKDWDKMSFEEVKSMKMEKLNMKSAMLDEAKTCVNNSKSKDEIKKCWDNMEKKKSAMGMQHDKHHKQSMEEQGEFKED